MRKVLTNFMLFTGVAAFAQEQDLAYLYVSKFYNDSIYHPSFTKTTIIKNQFVDFNVSDIIVQKKPVKKTLGFTGNNKPIELFYFPGTSSKKALVIGGVHGSELSSVEVARRLIRNLSAAEQLPYYSVIIVPALFVDNVTKAETCKGDRVATNIGRYTNERSIDPNRQLPALSKPFLINNAADAYGRNIENENALLLQLIQAYSPERIISIHAIKDQSKAGVYADPRTDCNGMALGYSSDSTLALLMAKYIDDNKGNAFGNRVKTNPTALYYLDPKASPQGEFQQRNLVGMNMAGKINGVSLGSWASTAVCDEENNYRRDAMRILTVEFPGYKKPSEYRLQDDRDWYEKQVTLYAASISHYFLQDYCVEENHTGLKELVAR